MPKGTRITDKQRLDWMRENKATLQWHFEGWNVTHALQMRHFGFHTNIRAAIDSAMEPALRAALKASGRASKKRRREARFATTVHVKLRGDSRGLRVH